jgi:hypothetical protein
MDYYSETLADRITRLLGARLKNPERTREILARLTDAQKQTPQPSYRERNLDNGRRYL